MLEVPVHMKPWSQLTNSERDKVRDQMQAEEGTSRNGVAGWYHQQRHAYQANLRIADAIRTPAPLEPLTLSDVKDILV